MLIIGLTGSIATGKSTVSQLLSSPPHNLPLIDADVLARTSVAPGTRAYTQIVAHFGPSTPDLLLAASTPAEGAADGRTIGENGSDGQGRPLDRAALGRRVFGSSEEAQRDRAALNGIVHPAVRRAMVRAVLGEYVRGSRVAVLDVPLLFESGLDVFCGVVLVVGIRDGQVQLKRLLDRDSRQGGSLTDKEARDRIASQADVASKVARCKERGAGWAEVVWNDGSTDDLEKEVSATLQKVLAGSPVWWEVLMWAFPPLAFVIAAYGIWCGRAARSRFDQKAKL